MNIWINLNICTIFKMNTYLGIHLCKYLDTYIQILVPVNLLIQIYSDIHSCLNFHECHTGTNTFFLLFGQWKLPWNLHLTWRMSQHPAVPLASTGPSTGPLQCSRTANPFHTWKFHAGILFEHPFKYCFPAHLLPFFHLISPQPWGNPPSACPV